MKNENLLKVMLLPCFAFVASVAFGAEDSHTFESTDGVAWSSDSWSGDTNIVTGVQAPTLTAGNPHETAAGGQVLVYEGTTTYNGAVAAGESMDFLLNATEAGDAFGEWTAPDAKFALTLDAERNWCVFCNDGTADTWVQTSANAPAGWVRVTLTSKDTKYGVSIDGIPLVSTAGFLKSTDTTKGADVKGFWYAQATSTEGAAINFAGIAQLDNFVIKEADAIAYPTDSSVAIKSSDGKTTVANVTLNDLNDWGVTAETATTVVLDNSGHTVAEKLELGYEPTDDKKFEPTAMELMTESGTQYAQISFPLPTRIDEPTYTVIVSDGETTKELVLGGTATDDSKVVDATPASDATAKILKIDLSTFNSRVLKFKLKAAK